MVTFKHCTITCYHTAFYVSSGEGVHGQPAVDHRPDGARGRRPDRDPRDDGQVLDRRDRQLRVRPQAGRDQRPGLGVPETRKDRVPAVAPVQDPSGRHIHAAVAARHFPRAPLLAPHHRVLPRRVPADHRAPAEDQRGPQGLCAPSDEGPRGPSVEPRLEARRYIVARGTRGGGRIGCDFEQRVFPKPLTIINKHRNL